MDTIPIRVNELERHHTLHDHRLKVLEGERLGERMALAERSAQEAKDGVESLRGEVSQLRRDQAAGFDKLGQSVNKMGQSVGRIYSLFKGAMWAFGVVGTLLVLLNLVVELVPKFDAIVIDKNPQSEFRE